LYLQVEADMDALLLCGEDGEELGPNENLFEFHINEAVFEVRQQRCGPKV
jgi:hypothetical protein